MAKMRGWLRGQRPGEVSRTSNSTMAAQLGTWHGKAQLVMDSDGQARLTVENDHHGPREVWAGNVERAHDSEGRQTVRRTEPRAGLEHDYWTACRYLRGEGRWLCTIYAQRDGQVETLASAYGHEEGVAWWRALAQLFRGDVPEGPPAKGPMIPADPHADDEGQR